MGQRRHHYEVAFEAFLRARRVPYVSVNEVRAAVLPEGAALRPDAPSEGRGQTLKNFDFVIYGRQENLLVEIKGRKLARPRSTRPGRSPSDARARPLIAPRAPARGRLESWVGRDDVEGLGVWQRLFGPEFRAVFVFVYWCDDQPPDALFEELFEYRGRWYALRAIDLDDYAGAMRTRSERWRTVHLATGDFHALSRPFAPPAMGLAPDPGDLEPALVPLG